MSKIIRTTISVKATKEDIDFLVNHDENQTVIHYSNNKEGSFILSKSWKGYFETYNVKNDILNITYDDCVEPNIIEIFSIFRKLNFGFQLNLHSYDIDNNEEINSLSFVNLLDNSNIISLRSIS